LRRNHTISLRRDEEREKTLFAKVFSLQKLIYINLRRKYILPQREDFVNRKDMTAGGEEKLGLSGGLRCSNWGLSNG